MAFWKLKRWQMSGKKLWNIVVSFVIFVLNLLRPRLWMSIYFGRSDISCSNCLDSNENDVRWSHIDESINQNEKLISIAIFANLFDYIFSGDFYIVRFITEYNAVIIMNCIVKSVEWLRFRIRFISTRWNALNIDMKNEAKFNCFKSISNVGVMSKIIFWLELLRGHAQRGHIKTNCNFLLPQ